jgi:predicted regulator of Ras-like GTPase activity (Roadblock/LC7/MglB family)
MTSHPYTHPLQGPAQAVATSLLEALDGARATLVCTSDGFALAHAKRQDVDMDRLAAVVSSIGALGDAAARETAIGAPRCVLVDASQGRLLVRSVACGKHALIVAVLTDASIVLGMVWAQMVEAERLLSRA